MIGIVPQLESRYQRLLQAIRKGDGGPAVVRASKYCYPITKDQVGVSQIGAVEGDSAVDDAAKSILFTVTKLNEDRDGDIVMPQGCRVENYARNPVWFFGHQEWEVPIGKGVDDKRRLHVFISKDAIQARCFFDTKDSDAMYIFDKCARGYLNATSIAFVPIRAHRRTYEEKATARQTDKPLGWVFQEYDLTEISIVGVPSNSEAIRASLDHEKSYISPRLQKALKPYAAVVKGCWGGWCPGPVTKAGKCGRGERSDLTGCTPASGGGEKKPSAKPAEATSAKPAGKPAAKPSARPAGKPAKPASKPASSLPGQKPTGRKPAAKPASGKASDLPGGKSDRQVNGKYVNPAWADKAYGREIQTDPKTGRVTERVSWDFVTDNAIIGGDVIDVDAKTGKRIFKQDEVRARAIALEKEYHDNVMEQARRDLPRALEEARQEAERRKAADEAKAKAAADAALKAAAAKKNRDTFRGGGTSGGGKIEFFASLIGNTLYALTVGMFDALANIKSFSSEVRKAATDDPDPDELNRLLPLLAYLGRTYQKYGDKINDTGVDADAHDAFVEALFTTFDADQQTKDATQADSETSGVRTAASQASRAAKPISDKSLSESSGTAGGYTVGKPKKKAEEQGGATPGEDFGNVTNCAGCGYQLPDGSKYCPGCGKPTDLAQKPEKGRKSRKKAQAFAGDQTPGEEALEEAERDDRGDRVPHAAGALANLHKHANAALDYLDQEKGMHGPEMDDHIEQAKAKYEDIVAHHGDFLGERFPEHSMDDLLQKMDGGMVAKDDEFTDADQPVEQGTEFDKAEEGDEFSAADVGEQGEVESGDVPDEVSDEDAAADMVGDDELDKADEPADDEDLAHAATNEILDRYRNPAVQQRSLKHSKCKCPGDDGMKKGKFPDMSPNTVANIGGASGDTELTNTSDNAVILSEVAEYMDSLSTAPKIPKYLTAGMKYHANALKTFGSSGGTDGSGGSSATTFGPSGGTAAKGDDGVQQTPADPSQQADVIKAALDYLDEVGNDPNVPKYMTAGMQDYADRLKAISDGAGTAEDTPQPEADFGDSGGTSTDETEAAPKVPAKSHKGEDLEPVVVNRIEKLCKKFSQATGYRFN